MSEAAALLAAPTSTPEQIELALEAVIRDGAHDAFAKAFGPRRLMKALASGRLTERCEMIADQLLSGDCAATGLTPSLEFAEVLHHDELFPDEEIDLSSVPTSQLPHVDQQQWPLRLADGDRAVTYFSPETCRVVREDAGISDERNGRAPILKLTCLSRRARIGSEIECKVWPAAVILGRWLWRHRWLLRGRTVLELGAGVGTVGLASATCGAGTVLITDINQLALRCARENVQKNGPMVRAVCRVAHLDWASPPPLGTTPAGSGAGGGLANGDGGASTDELLRGQFELILMADVINAEGLSEMVRLLVARAQPSHKTRTIAVAPLMMADSSPLDGIIGAPHIRPYPSVPRRTGVFTAAALPCTKRAGADGVAEAAPPTLCRAAAHDAARLGEP